MYFMISDLHQRHSHHHNKKIFCQENILQMYFTISRLHQRYSHSRKICQKEIFQMYLMVSTKGILTVVLSVRRNIQTDFMVSNLHQRHSHCMMFQKGIHVYRINNHMLMSELIFHFFFWFCAVKICTDLLCLLL